MNLHDINYGMPNIDLIADYLMAYYRFDRVRVGIDRRTVDYQFDRASWDTMSERDVLTYTNRALDWALRGRPFIPG